jgi:hypothetical protein
MVVPVVTEDDGEKSPEAEGQTGTTRIFSFS